MLEVRDTTPSWCVMHECGAEPLQFINWFRAASDFRLRAQILRALRQRYGTKVTPPPVTCVMLMIQHQIKQESVEMRLDFNCGSFQDEQHAIFHCTLPQTVSLCSQEIRVLILRGKSTGCYYYFVPRATTNSILFCMN